MDSATLRPGRWCGSVVGLAVSAISLVGRVVGSTPEPAPYSLPLNALPWRSSARCRVRGRYGRARRARCSAVLRRPGIACRPMSRTQLPPSDTCNGSRNVEHLAASQRKHRTGRSSAGWREALGSIVPERVRARCPKLEAKAYDNTPPRECAPGGGRSRPSGMEGDARLHQNATGTATMVVTNTNSIGPNRSASLSRASTGSRRRASDIGTSPAESHPDCPGPPKCDCGRDCFIDRARAAPRRYSRPGKAQEGRRSRSRASAGTVARTEGQEAAPRRWWARRLEAR